MTCSGRIERDDLLDASRAGAVIKAALSQIYAEARFLGRFELQDGDQRYIDSSTGAFHAFAGVKTIWRGKVKLYELTSHGGLIRA